MSNYALIKQAILEKRSVDCYYNKFLRKMSPHTLGTSKRGIHQALFYQYGRQSSKGLSPNADENWRCIPIDNITDLVINVMNLLQQIIIQNLKHV